MAKKTCVAPLREKLVARLHKKFGRKVFTFTELQREIVEMHGLDYDEKVKYRFWRADGTSTIRQVRRHRGWYCASLYPTGAYRNGSKYLFGQNKNGLHLKHVAYGKYQLV